MIFSTLLDFPAFFVTSDSSGGLKECGLLSLQIQFTSSMWKVLLLGLYTVLAVRGLAKGAPFQPEEKWKPLDNPRNRELVRKSCKKDSLSFVLVFFVWFVFHHENFSLLNLKVKGAH